MNMKTASEQNKKLVLDAFNTLFNKRDYTAAEKFWSPKYIQHSAHIPPGREGLFNMVKGSPAELKYEHGLIMAEGDFVFLHGKYTNTGMPMNWIIVDIVRIENGILAEHWDVIQDESTKEQSKSGMPMFGNSFPKSEEQPGLSSDTKGHKLRVGQVEIYAEEKGEGGPALVFLHYWGGSRRTWSQVIEPLSKRFRCIAIDLRGWGKSDHHAKNYNLLSQADDVEGVIEELNLMDFVLVGHSMGGKIAQVLAGRRLNGLRGVVLVAPAPPTPLHVPDTQKQTMLASYTMPEGIADALKVISHRPLTLAQRLQVTEDSLGGAEGAKTTWVSQSMPLDISKQTASINVPVCVIVGSADQIEKEDALREAILPLVPTARFKTIEGVGHLTPLEGPNEVVNAISDFLAEEKLSGNGKGTK
jgi:pimeloyl-ACP methyl ester carboxylesterase/predicted SnoaL-like aldol condensation-catalyzing enzyme